MKKKLTLNLLKKKNSIIALGGGGFLNKEIQKAVLSNNLSFWLNWETKILIKRIIGSPKRPVAYNSTKSELIEMINLRNKQYSKAMFKVDCSDLTKNEVVNKIINIYESKKLKINTGSHKYNVIIGNDLISKLSKLFSTNSIEFKKCLLLIDKRVPKNFIDKIKKSLKCEKTFYRFNANEKNKNIKTVQSILEILFKKNFSRGDCLITIGGGITGDIGGFTASLFKRGLKLVNIPTTLLAQVDSSIGGKTGVNNIYGKNQIGSFYQPNIVVSDIAFLKTLPEREFICGYGEILKHSLIANKKLYQFLCKNFENIINLKSPFIEKTIYESCKIKKNLLSKKTKRKKI